MSQLDLSVRLLDPRELAKMLGVTRQTIYLWRQAGRLPQPIRLGRRVIRWPEDEIRQWIRQPRFGRISVIHPRAIRMYSTASDSRPNSQPFSRALLKAAAPQLTH